MWAEITYITQQDASKKIQIFNDLDRSLDQVTNSIASLNGEGWLGVTHFRTGPYEEDEAFGEKAQPMVMGKMYGTELAVKNIEYNDYVVGFVVEFNDGRSINVQFEKYRNTNHPEPNYVAVIGAEGDETIDAFDGDERDWISQCVLNIDQIKQFGRDLTEIMYSENEEAIDLIKNSYPLAYSTVTEALEMVQG
jgi:cytidine deaminase